MQVRYDGDWVSVCVFYLFSCIHLADTEEDAEVQVFDYIPVDPFKAGILSRNDTNTSINLTISFAEEVQQEDDFVVEESCNLVIGPETKEVLSGTLNALVAWLTSASNPGTILNLFSPSSCGPLI